VIRQFLKHFIKTLMFQRCLLDCIVVQVTQYFKGRGRGCERVLASSVFK